jgi:hypothetical protein
MPRYHFNVEDGQSTVDGGGTELESLEVAKCEAVKLAGRTICEAAGEFWDRSEWSMTVTDEDGLTLFTLHVVGTEAPSTRTQASAQARLA